MLAIWSRNPHKAWCLMPEPILRPDGFLTGRTAKEAVKDSIAGPLAGGPGAFTHLEVIQGEAGLVRSQRVAFSEIKTSSDVSITRILENLTSDKLPVAGLDWCRTRIMGIVNVTPDSFSDGGLYAAADAAITHGRKLAKEGADILDIGGESTRPGAAEVSEAEETSRIGPVLTALCSDPVPVSIDTRKAGVMRAAAKLGVRFLNDVSALSFDGDSLEAAKVSGLPVILMHAQGTPGVMQRAPHYEDVLIEVYRYLEKRIKVCEQAGISKSRIIIDPGIGFGKTLDHNLSLLAGLSTFHGLGCPVLLGASRKRFIGELSNEDLAARRVPGSLAAVFQAAMHGVQIVRVHDVAETRQALDVIEAVHAA